MVATAAYHRAEKRGFQAGHEVEDWLAAENEIDAVLTTGGTGLTGRDVTPEAVEALFEKRMDGFSTLFHMVSFPKIGTSTVQSRATAGVAP